MHPAGRIHHSFGATVLAASPRPEARNPSRSKCRDSGLARRLSAVAAPQPQTPTRLSRLVWLGAHFGLMADAVVLAPGAHGASDAVWGGEV